MAYRTRIHYSDAQKGESLKSIGRLFDRPSSSIYNILSVTGGIRPSPRKRSKRALTLHEREEISRGIAGGDSIRTIADGLGCSPSTSSREINRNGGYDDYRAAMADLAAWHRASRPKPCKLVVNRRLARRVADKLRLLWSPEQISGWLKVEFPGEEYNQVSHETIYRSLYIQARGALKKELLQHLRTKRTIRRSKSASLKDDGLGKITNTVSISE
jgi:IS30 family transposase